MIQHLIFGNMKSLKWEYLEYKRSLRKLIQNSVLANIYTHLLLSPLVYGILLCNDHMQKKSMEPQDN